MQRNYHNKILFKNPNVRESNPVGVSVTSVDKKLITRWEYPNVMWTISSYLFTYVRLSVYIHWTGSNPIRQKVNSIQLKTFEFELDFAQYTYIKLICWLRLFAGPLMYHLPANVIIQRLLSFRTIPEVWKNLSWGSVLFSHPPEEKYLHGVWVVVHGYMQAR